MFAKDGFSAQRVKIGALFFSIAIAIWIVWRLAPGRSFPSPERDKLAPTGSPKQVSEIHIETAGDVPYVLATICGEQLWLCVDTGGNVSHLPDRFLSRLQIKETNSVSDVAGQRKSYLAKPIDILIDGHELRNFEATIFGGYTSTNPGAKWNVDAPTLGINALSSYRIVLDGAHGTMSLLDDSSPPTEETWVPFEGILGSIHQIISATTANGKTVRVFLDSGLSFSRASKSMLAHEGDKTISINVGGNSIVATPKEILDGPERVVEFLDGTEKKRVEMDCALGWDFLKHCRFEISFKYRKLRIQP